MKRRLISFILSLSILLGTLTVYVGAVDLSTIAEAADTETTVADTSANGDIQNELWMIHDFEYALIRGVKTELPGSSFVREDTVYVPLAAVADYLGYTYTVSSVTVTLLSGTDTVKTLTIGAGVVLENDVLYVAETILSSIAGVENIFKMEDIELFILTDDETKASGWYVDNYATMKTWIGGKAYLPALLFDTPAGAQILSDVEAYVGAASHPRLLADQNTFDEIRESTDALQSKWRDNFVLSVEKDLNTYFDVDTEGTAAFKTVTVTDDDGNEYTYSKSLAFRSPNYVYADVEYSGGTWLSGEIVSGDGYDSGGRLSNTDDWAAKMKNYAFAWQMTGEQKYADACYLLGVTLGSWEHWGEGHFLNCADMASEYAIAFDWIYHGLTEAQRTELANCLFRLISRPAYLGIVLRQNSANAQSVANPIIKNNAKHSNGWRCFGQANNWNTVCSAGVVLSSLALLEYDFYYDAPVFVSKTEGFSETETTAIAWHDVFATVMETCLSNIPNCLAQYAPDGAYIESIGYWNYGTHTYVRMIEGLLSSTGSDYGFYNTIGLHESFYYAHLLCDSDYTAWGFHDGSFSKVSRNTLYLASRRYNDPTLASYRTQMLNNGTAVTLRDILYYSPTLTEGTETEPPLDAYFGGLEIATLRSSWNAENHIFAGLHAGANQMSHADMDSGNFVLKMANTYWFSDPGADNYNIGNYFNTNYRYKFYKKTAEAHNTVFVDNLVDSEASVIYSEGQMCNTLSEEYSKITDFVTTTDGAYVIADLSPSLGDTCLTANRGLFLTNSRSIVVVQDEMTFDTETPVTWVATPNGVDSGKLVMELSEDGRTVYLTNSSGVTMRMTLLSEDASVAFEVVEAGEILLPSTVAVGQNDENYPLASKSPTRLVIHAGEKQEDGSYSGVLSFRVAVVCEIISSDSDEVGYEWCDMQSWYPTSNKEGGRTYEVSDTDGFVSAIEEIRTLAAEIPGAEFTVIVNDDVFIPVTESVTLTDVNLVILLKNGAAIRRSKPSGLIGSDDLPILSLIPTEKTYEAVPAFNLDGGSLTVRGTAQEHGRIEIEGGAVSLSGGAAYNTEYVETVYVFRATDYLSLKKAWKEAMAVAAAYAHPVTIRVCGDCEFTEDSSFVVSDANVTVELESGAAIIAYDSAEAVNPLFTLESGSLTIEGCDGIAGVGVSAYGAFVKNNGGTLTLRNLTITNNAQAYGYTISDTSTSRSITLLDGDTVVAEGLSSSYPTKAETILDLSGGITVADQVSATGRVASAVRVVNARLIADALTVYNNSEVFVDSMTDRVGIYLENAQLIAENSSIIGPYYGARIIDSDVSLASSKLYVKYTAVSGASHVAQFGHNRYEIHTTGICNLNFTNSTIGNVEEKNNNGIHVSSETTVSLKGCVLSANSATRGYAGGSITLSGCLVDCTAYYRSKSTHTVSFEGVNLFSTAQTTPETIDLSSLLVGGELNTKYTYAYISEGYTADDLLGGILGVGYYKDNVLVAVNALTDGLYTDITLNGIAVQYDTIRLYSDLGLVHSVTSGSSVYHAIIPKDTTLSLDLNGHKLYGNDPYREKKVSAYFNVLGTLAVYSSAPGATLFAMTLKTDGKSVAQIFSVSGTLYLGAYDGAGTVHEEYADHLTTYTSQMMNVTGSAYVYGGTYYKTYDDNKGLFRIGDGGTITIAQARINGSRLFTMQYESGTIEVDSSIVAAWSSGNLLANGSDTLKGTLIFTNTVFLGNISLQYNNASSKTAGCTVTIGDGCQFASDKLTEASEDQAADVSLSLNPYDGSETAGFVKMNPKAYTVTFVYNTSSASSEDETALINTETCTFVLDTAVASSSAALVTWQMADTSVSEYWLIGETPAYEGTVPQNPFTAEDGYTYIHKITGVSPVSGDTVIEPVLTGGVPLYGNISLYAAIDFNVYLPINATSVTHINGIPVENLPVQNGIYYRYSFADLAPKDAYRTQMLLLTVNNGDSTAEVIRYVSLLGYAKSLLSHSESESERDLILATLSYINETHKYFYETSDDIAVIRELLDLHCVKEKLYTPTKERVYEIPEETGPIAAAGLSLDAEVGLVIYVDASYEGSLAVTVGGRTYQARQSGTITVEDTNYSYAVFDLTLSQLLEEITVSAGESTLSYSLDTYLARVTEQEGIAPSYAASLYALAKAAKRYLINDV